MSDDGTIRQVEGTCTGIMERGEWTEFHIDIGRQYALKLSTKLDDIKTLGRLAGVNTAIWTFTERQGGPNPHKPGTFFKNRWLTNVEVGGSLDPSLAGQTSMSDAPTAGGISGGQMPDERGRSIERQVIVKAAMAVFPAGLITTQDQWFNLITKLDRWMHDEAAPAQQAQATPPEAPPGQTDDDIPFLWRDMYGVEMGEWRDPWRRG